MKLYGSHKEWSVRRIVGAGLRQVVMLLIAACFALGFFPVRDSYAQPAAPAKKPSVEPIEQPPIESYAPIGNSGYQIPIHEFRMKSIVGGDKREQKPPEEQTPESPPTQEQKPEPPRQPEVKHEPAPPPETPSTTAPRPRWLPFDPERRRPYFVPPPRPPVVEQPAPKEEQRFPVSPPLAPEKPIEVLPPKKEKLQTRSAPDLPRLKEGTRAKEAPKELPSETVESDDSSETSERIRLKHRREPRSVPAPPEPKTELMPQSESGLTGAAPDLPGLKEGTKAKETPKELPLETLKSDDSSATSERIRLKHRREPRSVPAPPEPKTELMPQSESGLTGAAPDLPGLKEGTKAKETLQELPLETLKSDDSAATTEGIRLEPRREPLVIPTPPKEEPESPETAPQPMAVPQPKTESTQPAPAKQPEPKPAPVEVPTPQTVPEPMREPTARPESPMERTQQEPLSPAPSESKEQKPPKETIPEPEQSPAPVKEVLPSPLDQDAPHSSEVRNYLRDTAPLLEELSLLMTKAPSLAVEDYDPSSGTPTAFEEDLSAKIEHMKRELQVLDSKTFAIIPPRKYTGFHSVIRESISETYQACDAVSEYLKHPTESNLRKLQDHLRKARTLIQRTRLSQN